MQRAARRLPLARALVALVAGAALLLCAWSGAAWADSDLRLAPLVACAWCAMALEPWRTREEDAAGEERATLVLAAGLSCVAWLPLHAAALVHDARLWPISLAEAVAPALCAFLSWTAAGLAARAEHGRAWHRAAFALALFLPLLELAVALGGAPQTGGASGWLRGLAACSPLGALLDLQHGGAAGATPWASVLCAGLLVARQFGAARLATLAPQESRR